MGLCSSRLYHFFAGHFTSQGAKLVTLEPRPAGRRDTAEEHFPPAAAAPAWDAAGGGTGRTARDVPVRSIGEEEGGKTAGRMVALRSATDINARSDEFIQRRKRALAQEAGPPGAV